MQVLIGGLEDTNPQERPYFPMETWNKHMETLEGLPHTNNMCEGGFFPLLSK